MRGNSEIITYFLGRREFARDHVLLGFYSEPGLGKSPFLLSLLQRKHAAAETSSRPWKEATKVVEYLPPNPTSILYKKH